jgi:hypothetical protein
MSGGVWMDFLKEFLGQLLGSLLWLLAPVAVIVVGGVLVGIGVKFALAIVGWTGSAGPGRRWSRWGLCGARSWSP